MSGRVDAAVVGSTLPPCPGDGFVFAGTAGAPHVRMKSSRWIGVLGVVALACAAEGEPQPGSDTEAPEAGTVGETSTDPTTTLGTGSSDPSQGTETSSDPDGSDSGSETGDPPPPAGGCFGPGERPASVSPSGIAMPSLDDERAAYTSFGWTWAPEAEPSYPGEPDFSVVDPDIHGSTEGDDLWTYMMMYERTGEQGYLDRASAWARYFIEDYAACVGDEYASFCYDRDAFGADHLFGWGLLAWYETMRDPAALAAAEGIGAVVESLWAPDSPFGCLPSSACTTYGTRQVGRHLLFATRLAEVTGDARWETLRDQIIDTLLASEDWDDALGMIFYGEYSTDEALGAGAYAGGARIVSPFQIGVLSEALDQAYRVTGREERREWMVAMAAFVEEHGLDPVYDYTASSFGIVGGATWHSYGAMEPVEFWDPVYTTSLVNVLVRGFRYTCDVHYYERAQHFFERGNKGIYGEPVERAAEDGVVHHFVDTVFSSADGLFYLDYNKGELQYTYLLFAPVEETG